jgi:hypothetical protein
MRAIAQRLAKLEQETPDAALCVVWVNTGETAAEAVARTFPDGVPDGARLIVLQWGDSDGRGLE